MAERKRGFTTRALAAYKNVGEVEQTPASPPIYQAATFVFDDMANFEAVAKSKISGGYLYSRWANPTVEALARTIASLEGAQETACFGSGMAAIAASLQTQLRHGDHVVAATQLYGGAHGLLGTMQERSGIEVTKTDVSDHDAIAAAFTGRTRVLYCETIGNPTLDVADLDRLAAIAHERDAVLIVDSTFAPPAIVRPIEHGADLVLHSATKYLGGHSDLTAGVVSGNAERIRPIRMTALDTGGILSPFEAWLTARGVQTLDLRLDRICANALALARMLESHPGVQRALYPGLASHPQHELAARLMGARFGGMIAFEVGGGVEAGRRFLERVRVAAPAASLGSTKTLVVHPASVTHTQLSPAQRLTAGVTDGMVRVSVGIEDIEDLLEDFDQALR